MFTEIKIEDAGFNAMLDRVIARVSDLTPLMGEISRILYNQTMENFDAEGRPGWQALASATILQRAAQGTWPGKILDRGRGSLDSLRGSITSDHSDHEAIVGVGGVAGQRYARIQQLGGKAGRGRKVTIPARPYLPATADGKLQPETEYSIIEALNDYLTKA